MRIRQVPEWAANLTLAEQVAAARGVTRDQLDFFLNPAGKNLPHPASAFPQVEEAARLLADAVLAKKRVLVWGDYDADGVCALAIMTSLLDGRTEYRVHAPERAHGYGINADILRQLLDDFRPDVLVTVDCGITAGECVAKLREQGVCVIVTDHHLATAKPDADIVVDPILENSGLYKHLCGAGVAWLVARRTEGMLEEKGADRRDMTGWLMLAGIATVADVVPLDGANRFIVRSALRQLQSTDHPGLQLLKERMGLSEKKRLSSIDIGFSIGPCINAAGRMDSPTHAYAMLCGPDAEARRDAAERCVAFNENRKALEAAILEDLEGKGDQGRVVVVDAPAGILGLLAGRLTEKNALPTVVLRVEDGVATGSCRAPDGYPLNEILEHCGEHLLGFGGHAKAAGCRLKEEAIEAFRARFTALCEERNPEPAETVADMELRPDMITLEALESLYRLEPYGEGHPQPLFYLTNAVIEDARTSKDGKHLLFMVRSGDRLFHGKKWRAGELLGDIRDHPKRGLLVRIEEPYWDENAPELEVVEFL